jgi:phage regulator Rha-like protein
MLDRDLAELYGVTTGRLNEAIKRNIKRFPPEFMFQLTAKEAESLISQIAISKTGRGGRRRSEPYVFTEQGVAMTSSVLRSDRAIQINILIIKAFVRMRELLETNEVLRAKLNTMEQQLGSHSKQIRNVYAVLQRLIDEPVKPKNQIGFQSPKGWGGK